MAILITDHHLAQREAVAARPAGCSQPGIPFALFYFGDAMKRKRTLPPLCACGCEQPVGWNKSRHKWNRYIVGHNSYGKLNPHWKGGKIRRYGYIYLKMPDHPYCNKQGYVKEDRIIMEKILGRYLTPKEIVHHKDENGENNSPENLQLFPSRSDHQRFHTTGKSFSEERKYKISIAQKGERNHNFGKTASPETRMKMSISHKRRIM